MSIVLATDGKPHSNNAIDYAFTYAKNFNESLYVVRVITPRMEPDIESILESAHASFEKLKERAREEGVEIHTLLEHGNPAESVIALAERVEASAVIIGTSEKTTLDRVILGSISDHIVRSARSVVIVVR